MKVEKIGINPMGWSIEPEFHITVEYSYREKCLMPLRFNGYLFLDMHRIAFLTEYEYKNGRNDNFQSMNVSRGTEKREVRNFVAPLSRHALSRLEEKRNSDPKGDMKFNLHIQFVCIESLFNSVRLKSADNVTLPSLTNNSLFNVVTYDVDENIKISSGDWLHNFNKVFQQSRYHVFELPVPDSLNTSEELSLRLNGAIDSLKEMEKAKLSGDWEGVLKESRPVWELIRNKQEIDQLLRQDELNEETIKSFKNLISNLFDFSSKFIHKESQSKELMTINKARKEDAELIYALSVSLINLLSKKLTRYK